MRRGGGGGSFRRQSSGARGGGSGGGSGRRFSTQTSGGGDGSGSSDAAARGAGAGAQAGGGSSQSRPGLDHAGGSGRRSGGGGGGGRRSQVKELSDQEIRGMIQSSNVQYTVSLQLDTEKITALKTHKAEFEERLKDPDCNVVERTARHSTTVQLAVFGLNDWEELIEFERVIAGLRRPTRANQASGSEAEAALECCARVDCDASLTEWKYELAFSPAADDAMWTFTNELLLQLRSAGIYGRPLLPMRSSHRVVLASAFSRSPPFDEGDAERLEWSGEMPWNCVVVYASSGSSSAIVQSVQLPPAPSSSGSSSASPAAASLRYPALEPLVDELLAHSAKSKRPAVVILRGIPGSGKSTFGREIDALCRKRQPAVRCEILSADHFFVGPRGYAFDVKNIGKAHDACKHQFEDALRKNKASIVVVDNTHTQLWEFEHYVDRARSSGCRVQVLEMHCADVSTCIQMAKRNSHGVSVAKVIQMYLRWEADDSALSFTPQFEHALINRNPISRSNASSVVYVGLFIGPEERAKLLGLFPPIHSNVFGEHVTIFYRPTKAYVRNVGIGEEVSVRAVELVQDDRGQTLRVEFADPLPLKMRNKIPHVTISTKNDVGAYYSNELLEDSKASRIALSGDQRVTIEARLGAAVLTQNQRVTTLTSPFGNLDSCLRSRGCGAISKIVMVIIDEKSLAVAAGSISERTLLSRLALREQVEHHAGSSCNTRRVLCLKQSDPSSVTNSDAALKSLEDLLLLSPSHQLAFDRLVVFQDENLVELLEQVHQDAAAIKKIVVLTTLSEHLSSPLASDERFRSAAVSISKLSLPSARADASPSVLTAPFALTLEGVMDCLSLGVQERTRHDIQTGMRVARSAWQSVLGRDSSDAVVVERSDSSVAGLDADVIELCALAGDEVNLDAAQLQRQTVEALVALGASHALAGRESGCVYFEMCSSAACSPVFRLTILTPSDRDSPAHKRMAFCQQQRESVQQQLRETETYTVLVALLRAVLRSHCLHIAGDCVSGQILDLMSERFVLAFLQQSSACSSQRADADTSESSESGDKSDTVRLLLQLLEFLGDWCDAKWSNELAIAQDLFGLASEAQVQQRELVDAVATALSTFRRAELETRGEIYRVNADKRSTALLQLVVALVQRKSAQRPYRTGQSDEAENALVRGYAKVTSATSALDVFALCGAMRNAASNESVNPRSSGFACAPSLLVQTQRVEVVAATRELLEQIIADAQHSNLINGQLSHFRAVRC